MRVECLPRMNLGKKLGTLGKTYRTGGVRAVVRRFMWRFGPILESRRYGRWMRNNSLTDERAASIRSEIEAFPRRPLISVILPVYNVDEKWLRRCIDSVRSQIYGDWELCIADDKSPASHIRPVLESYAAADQRIKVVFREVNGHIANASNSALGLATGEFSVLLDHDDELSPDALYFVARTVLEHPDTEFIYSDEDMIDEAGRRFGPKFKPDFSRDLLCSLNLITHLSAYRTETIRAVGAFRPGTEGSQDYDLALRVLERCGEERVRHVPEILYHWRAIRGSVALSADEKPYAHEAAREAIRSHLARCGKSATVTVGEWNLHRVVYELPDPAPKIAVVVFGNRPGSGDLPVDYPNFETVLSGAAAADLNLSAGGTKSELLCFINAGCRPVDRGWLRELAGFATQPEIGVVGGKISSLVDSVVSAGYVIGGPELVRPAHAGLFRRDPGNMARNILISNFSAVPADCLMIRRDLFDELGGFDAADLPNALFDADLCLRIRELGLRVVVDPFAGFECEIDIGRTASTAERNYFSGRWAGVLKADPFYNPNLARSGTTFRIDPRNKRR